MSDFTNEIWMAIKMCTINWYNGIIVGSFEGVLNQWVAALAVPHRIISISLINVQSKILRCKLTYHIMFLNDFIIVVDWTMKYLLLSKATMILLFRVLSFEFWVNNTSLPLSCSHLISIFNLRDLNWDDLNGSILIFEYFMAFNYIPFLIGTKPKATIKYHYNNNAILGPAWAIIKRIIKRK